MKKVKIIRKFFTKDQAMAEAIQQRIKADKKNVPLTKVEVVCAYKLYQTNGWYKNNPFKKLGVPMTDCFMVIVHYSTNSYSPMAIAKLGRKISRANRNNLVSSSFFVVRLNTDQMVENHNIVTVNKITAMAGDFQYKHIAIYPVKQNKVQFINQRSDSRSLKTA